MTQIDVRLVTYAGCAPVGDYDSVHLVRALRDRDLQTDVHAWDDPTTDWAEARVTVIRSTWDYHHAVARFLAWARRTANVTRLFNPPSLLDWNVNKRYLMDLELAGVPIVPTIVAEPADAGAALDAVKGVGWQDIVVKPAISLDGHGVLRVAVDSVEASTAIARICETGPAILQPFVPEIESAGEVSLAFIDGHFTHAVKKRPAAGDFRVQERLGGTVVATMPPRLALELGELVLSRLEETPLYARVDVIASAIGMQGGGEHYLLTELELVEPSLFMAESDGTAAVFADAIAARL